jgi:quercetin dioxygenase-like cupin family protein
MSVIVEADRLAQARQAGVPIAMLVGKDDGASRIWLMSNSLPVDFHIGLHRHHGDEIWRVTRGTLRITVNGEQVLVNAGEIAVVPPDVEHGVKAVCDADAEVIGEYEMGSWYTVIDPDGSHREVETHVPFMPWDRPPGPGEHPTSFEDLLQLFESTAHLL